MAHRKKYLNKFKIYVRMCLFIYMCMYACMWVIVRVKFVGSEPRPLIPESDGLCRDRPVHGVASYLT